MAHDINLIYETLKEKITCLELLPGTKIKEEDLAREFGVSRSPIRSVISRLEKDGLVNVVSQKGTYVSKIDITNIKDYLFIRESVEISIIRLVSQTFSDEDAQVLEKILNEQKVLSEMEPSIEKSKMFFDNDNKFHIALYKMAGHNEVWKLLYQNTTPLNRARLMANLRETQDVQKVFVQHFNVYYNLKNHNVEKAVEAMKKHLDEGFDGIDEIIKKYNDFFKED